MMEIKDSNHPGQKINLAVFDEATQKAQKSFESLLDILDEFTPLAPPPPNPLIRKRALERRRKRKRGGPK